MPKLTAVESDEGLTPESRIAALSDRLGPNRMATFEECLAHAEAAEASSLPDRHTGTDVAKFHDERDILLGDYNRWSINVEGSNDPAPLRRYAMDLCKECAQPAIDIVVLANSANVAAIQ